MTLADRIVVLSRNGLEQFGTPDELFDTPANLFVAGFIFSHRMNLIAVDAAHSPLLEVLTGQTHAMLAAQGIGTIGARPEDLQLVSGDDAGVQLVERLGAESLVHLDLPGMPGTVAVLSTDRGLAFGQRRALHLDPRHLHRFDARGRRLTA